MKKTFGLMAIATMLACSSFAQDSTKMMSKHTTMRKHKMNNNSSMSDSSMNASGSDMNTMPMKKKSMKKPGNTPMPADSTK